MKTYRLYTKNNHFFAFETVYVSSRKIIQLLKAIDEVTGVGKELLPRSSDICLKFKYKDEKFIAWEPFGDNSRYCIGPNGDELPNIDITSLEEPLKNHRPSFLRKIFGNLISLNFKAIFIS